MNQTVRVLRILVYTGNRDFVSSCIERRAVRGTHRIPGMGEIREAILEPEDLDIGLDDNTVEMWSHSCNVVLNKIDLWISRCPHCGRPHDYQGPES